MELASGQTKSKIEKREIVLRADVECKNLTEVTKAYDALGVGYAMRLKTADGAESPFRTGDFLIKIGEENVPYEQATFVYTFDDAAQVLKNKTPGDVVWLWTGDRKKDV